MALHPVTIAFLHPCDGGKDERGLGGPLANKRQRKAAHRFATSSPRPSTCQACARQSIRLPCSSWRARVGTRTWNTVVPLMLMPHDHLEQLCEGAWPLGVTLADGRYSPCRRQENGEAPVRGQEGGKE